MVANTHLEDVAHELLEHELSGTPRAERAAADGVMASPKSSSPTEYSSRFCQESILHHILPELVVMLEELHDRPVESLAPMIRRRLLEQDFVDEHGDSMHESSMQAEVDVRVAQLLRVLEQLRQIAADQGLWSDAPVTPIMFG